MEPCRSPRTNNVGSARSSVGLHRDDPKFAVGQSIERTWQRRMVAAGATVLVGMVLLLVEIITTQAILMLGVIISVTGFRSMVGGAALLTRRPRN